MLDWIDNIVPSKVDILDSKGLVLAIEVVACAGETMLHPDICVSGRLAAIVMVDCSDKTFPSAGIFPSFSLHDKHSSLLGMKGWWQVLQTQEITKEFLGGSMVDKREAATGL